MKVHLLQNVNIDLLPATIKTELEKIYLKFRGVQSNTSLLIIQPLTKLYKLQLQNFLFENEEKEDQFVLMTNEKLNFYISKYHDGFRKGYNEYNDFLQDVPFNDLENSIRINRVFTGIYNKFEKLNQLPLIEIDEMPENNFLCIDLHFVEYGFEVGTFVKCWDIILNDFNLFEKVFDKYFTINNSEKPFYEVYQDSNIDVFSFENNFDKVDKSRVYDYFKNTLVNKNYLNLEDLHRYLKTSFDQKQIPKTKFILKKPTVLKHIRKIFYTYFNEIAQKPNGKQSDYVKLLTDYFQGYDFTKVKNNFNK